MDRFASMVAFVRVIETGSFSEAARFLRLGQPAVSKSVAQMEARLGVKLLTRTTRGLCPTEAGQRFYERAKRALEAADQADVAARGAGNGLEGRLRISAPVTFARIHPTAARRNRETSSAGTCCPRCPVWSYRSSSAPTRGSPGLPWA